MLMQLIKMYWDNSIMFKCLLKQIEIFTQTEFSVRVWPNAA